jgi:hypothetical protein
MPPLFTRQQMKVGGVGRMVFLVGVVIDANDLLPLDDSHRSVEGVEICNLDVLRVSGIQLCIRHRNT